MTELTESWKIWDEFETGLIKLINQCGIDDKLNIPDRLLAKYITMSCLDLAPLLNYKHYEEKIELRTE